MPPGDKKQTKKHICEININKLLLYKIAESDISSRNWK